MDLCTQAFASVDYCPQLCPTRAKSCANTAASGFVERKTEIETAGNQNVKECALHTNSETDCKRAGCSWRTTWDMIVIRLFLITFLFFIHHYRTWDRKIDLRNKGF